MLDINRSDEEKTLILELCLEDLAILKEFSVLHFPFRGWGIVNKSRRFSLSLISFMKGGKNDI